MERVDKLLYGSLAGLVLGVGWTRRIQKNAALISRLSTWGLAGRALLISSIISVSSFGVATAALAKYLQVNSIKEFGAYMTKHMEGLAPQAEQSTKYMESWISEANK